MTFKIPWADYLQVAKEAPSNKCGGAAQKLVGEE